MTRYEPKHLFKAHLLSFGYTKCFPKFVVNKGGGENENIAIE
jgi:hypothetical protein